MTSTDVFVVMKMDSLNYRIANSARQQRMSFRSCYHASFFFPCFKWRFSCFQPIEERRKKKKETVLSKLRKELLEIPINSFCPLLALKIRPKVLFLSVR